MDWRLLRQGAEPLRGETGAPGPTTWLPEENWGDSHLVTSSQRILKTLDHEPQRYSWAERRRDKENEEQGRQPMGRSNLRVSSQRVNRAGQTERGSQRQVRGRETGKKGCRVGKSARSGVWNLHLKQRDARRLEHTAKGAGRETDQEV